ncbi:MAG: HD-GYP domain-containing protein [Gemmatimonadales bacterium]
MSTAAQFLISFGQALATMGLYQEGHPSRERALESSYDRLRELLEEQAPVEYSFIGEETILGDHPLLEVGRWEWGHRLAAVGVERIEIDRVVPMESWLGFVEEVWRRLTGRPDFSSEARQLVTQPIRYGSLRVRGTTSVRSPLYEEGAALLGGFAVSLQEEAEAVGWIHTAVQGGDRVPMHEVESVVRSLAATMRCEGQVLFPLLELKRFDQYTTTHACNVAVLAMGLAEQLELSRAEIRSFGVAGLLHDIGKVRIPKEILTKPGKLSDEERGVMQRHPVDGAQLLLERERGLGVAAVVAYEHHVWLDGGGYPTFRYPRQCHHASQIVHVCDIYDALCTNRPYRDAWSPEKALSYLAEQSGKELNADLVKAFTRMIQEGVHQRVSLADAESVAAA